MKFQSGLADYFRQRDRGWVLGLLAIVCLLYLPFLGSPFVFDDANFFSGGVPDYYAHSIFHFDLRWLPLASLGWTYAVFSDVQPHFYHLGNVLIHAANVITLFYLLRQLIDAAIPDYKNPNNVVLGAWFGALIFAIHPVAVYAVGYIIERSILMATLFALLMQLTYLRGLLSGRRRWLALAVLAYFLACFSKEHSVLMPLVLVAETILLRGKIQASRPMLWLTWGAFIAVGLLVTLRTQGVFGSPYEVGAAMMFEQEGIVESTPMLHVMSVLTQAGLFFKYLLLWLIPNPVWMSVDMREPFLADGNAWQACAGAVGFIAYGGLSIWLLLRSRWQGLVGLAMLYPWLQFLLEFSTIRVQEIFVLYRSYLWMPGLMLFIPLLLEKWPGKKTWYVVGLAILLLMPLAWNRLWAFTSDFRLWDDAAKLLRTGDEPLASRIYYNRALALANLGKWEAATSDYEKAVAHNPKLDPIMVHALGAAYFNTRRYQEALVQFDQAIILSPEYAKAYFDRGMTLKMLHRDGSAMHDMIKACELKYSLACVIVNFDPHKT